MGYSCLAIASEAATAMLAVLNDNAEPWSGNGWQRDGRCYFWECGRERADGAVTGTVYALIHGSEGRCMKAGSIRVDETGIVRWPTSTKAERDQAWLLAQALMEQRRGMIPFAEL